MAECECKPGCPFFNDKMSDQTGLGSSFKRQYCMGDNKGCARYMVFKKMGKAAVPINLYPNMKDRALEIMAGR